MKISNVVEIVVILIIIVTLVDTKLNNETMFNMLVPTGVSFIFIVCLLLIWDLNPGAIATIRQFFI